MADEVMTPQQKRHRRREAIRYHRDMRWWRGLREHNARVIWARPPPEPPTNSYNPEWG